MPDYTFSVTVTEAQEKCIADSVLDWQAWCERAAQYVVNHKAEQCRERLIARDEGLLGDNIRKDRDARAAAIMALPGYRDRAQREAAGA